MIAVYSGLCLDIFHCILFYSFFPFVFYFAGICLFIDKAVTSMMIIRVCFYILCFTGNTCTFCILVLNVPYHLTGCSVNLMHSEKQPSSRTDQLLFGNMK